MLVLPLSMVGRFRKNRPGLNRLQTIAVLLLSVGIAGTSFVGCSDPVHLQNYSVVITATSGATQHSSTVTLAVD